VKAADLPSGGKKKKKGSALHDVAEKEEKSQGGEDRFRVSGRDNPWGDEKKGEEKQKGVIDHIRKNGKKTTQKEETE